jgi:hypothetical protein
MRPQARRPDPDGDEADVDEAEHQPDPEHQPVVLIPRLVLLVPGLLPHFKPFLRRSVLLGRNLCRGTNGLRIGDCRPDQRWYRAPQNVILERYRMISSLKNESKMQLALPLLRIRGLYARSRSESRIRRDISSRGGRGSRR